MANCSSCPSHETCTTDNQNTCSTQQVPQFAPLAKGSNISTVIAVGSGKGGVGKSTMSAALAVLLRRKGLRVAVLDADITGPSMGEAFGVDKVTEATEDQLLVPPRSQLLDIPVLSLNSLLESKTDPVIWRGPMVVRIIQQFWSEVAWGELDVLVIDMPPGTGDVPLTIFQSIPTDRFMLVSTPQSLVQMIVTKAQRMAQMMHVPLLGLVENMSYILCDDCGKKLYPFGTAKTQQTAEKMHLPFLDEVRLNPILNEWMDNGEIEKLEENILPEAVAAVQQLVERKRAIRASMEE